jgi:hypothetical protein
MMRSEMYSWCIFISIGALATLAADIPGLLCVICGMVVGNIDVAWIDDQVAKPREEPTKVGSWHHTTGETMKPSARERARLKALAKARKLPPNVVEFHPKIKTAEPANNRKQS